jgi:hypothetical protein
MRGQVSGTTKDMSHETKGQTTSPFRGLSPVLVPLRKNGRTGVLGCSAQPSGHRKAQLISWFTPPGSIAPARGGADEDARNDLKDPRRTQTRATGKEIAPYRD